MAFRLHWSGGSVHECRLALAVSDPRPEQDSILGGSREIELVRISRGTSRAGITIPVDGIGRAILALQCRVKYIR